MKLPKLIRKFPALHAIILADQAERKLPRIKSKIITLNNIPLDEYITEIIRESDTREKSVRKTKNKRKYKFNNYFITKTYDVDNYIDLTIKEIFRTEIGDEKKFQERSKVHFRQRTVVLSTNYKAHIQETKYETWRSFSPKYFRITRKIGFLYSGYYDSQKDPLIADFNFYCKRTKENYRPPFDLEIEEEINLNPKGSGGTLEHLNNQFLNTHSEKKRRKIEQIELKNISNLEKDAKENVSKELTRSFPNVGK